MTYRTVTRFCDPDRTACAVFHNTDSLHIVIQRRTRTDVRSIGSQVDLMVVYDIFPVTLSPKGGLNKVILVGVERLPIIQQYAPSITGVGVNAPKRMVRSLLGHGIGKRAHPFLVFPTVHFPPR